MMSAANGSLLEVAGRPALRFERVMPHPPERVWESVTDPDKQSAWHPSPATIEPRVGGRVQFASKGEFPDGEVTDYEPPRLLGYTWGASGPEADHLRWELHPHDEGCLLVLVHTFEDRLKAARDGAGWHVCLDRLANDLSGDTAASRKSSWSELNHEYQRQFGISPEEATPPPH